MDVLLGRGVSLAVLRVLTRHGGQLPLFRIVQESGRSRAAVAAILDDLVRMRVVDRAGAGRVALYRADGRHPLAATMTRLFDDEATFRDGVVAAIRDAADTPRMRALWLFGSVTRFEDGPWSDIDLEAVFDAADELVVEDEGDAFRDRLGEQPRLFGLRPSVLAMSRADVRRLIASRPGFWKAIEREGSTLVGPSPAEYGREMSRDG